MMFQSPLNRGTLPDCTRIPLPTDLGKVSIPSKSGHSSRRGQGPRYEKACWKFQSPLNRGTLPDCNVQKIIDNLICKFQSPLNRGTLPDLVEIIETIATSKFQSPLSRGTLPDQVHYLSYNPTYPKFQSPLSRGTLPDSIRFKSLSSNKKKGPKRRPHPHPPPLALSQL